MNCFRASADLGKKHLLKASVFSTTTCIVLGIAFYLFSTLPTMAQYYPQYIDCNYSSFCQLTGYPGSYSGNYSDADQGEMNVAVTIDNNGAVIVNIGHIDEYNNISPGDTFYGEYDFNTHLFSVSGNFLSTPASALFGPASIWVEGTVYSWITGLFDDENHASGNDLYGDGNGHTLTYTVYNSGYNQIGGTTPRDTSMGGIFNGLFIITEGSGNMVDVRQADASGNPIIGLAPSGMPPALRVAGNSSLWHYLGYVPAPGNPYHCYARSSTSQWLFIDSLGVITIPEQGGYDGSRGAYCVDSLVWIWGNYPTVRAVSPEGVPVQPSTQPTIGPPAVWVAGTLWRFAGTAPWYSSVQGDYYIGSNDAQQLVIGPTGGVTITNLTYTATGTYISPSGSLPGLFLVQGVEVLPGDTDSSIYHQNDALFGPPAIWVNGITYQFINSEGLTENPSDPSAWVDRYSDGSGGWVIMTNSGVTIYAADASIIWTGTYTSWTGNPANGGVFVRASNYYGVEPQPSNGTGLIPPYGSPHGNHPVVVKFDGLPYRFRGSLGGETPNDYYFGEAGLGLWIDSSNNVTQSILLGVFVGTVFVKSAEVNYDLRACYSNLSPVAPGTTPQWGPAAVWVEGVPWAYLGTVSDETLQIHADYYGGPNAGQVLTIDSSHQIGGAHSGIYNNGLIISSSGDLRALDSSGLFIASGGPPSQDRPSTLRFGAQQWHFLGNSGGNDYYATDEPGQRLTIAEDGSVTYYDRPNNIASASGTYSSSDGTITAQSGGIVYDVGTNKGDLDILGNILSLGSLTGNKNTAGVTIAFRDDTSVAESPSSSLSLTLTRPNATWLWSHGTGSSTTTQAMMSLDSAHRLNLYDPAVATANPDPVVRLDPNPAGKSKLGNVSITGSIRFQPAGDIEMGIYTAGPQP